MNSCFTMLIEIEVQRESSGSRHLQVDELESTSQVPIPYNGLSVGPIEPAL